MSLILINNDFANDRPYKDNTYFYMDIYILFTCVVALTYLYTF